MRNYAEIHDVISCRSKAAAAGTVNDHGDQRPAALAGTKAMSTPPNSNPVPWKDSKAKDLLAKDILSGFVPDAMTAKEVYNDTREGRHLLYAPYDFKNFVTNLRNLRKLLRTQEVLAVECQANLERELLLYPPSDMDPRGYPRWDRSKAPACLKKDVTEMLAGNLIATPSQLHASNPEYRRFPLKVFIDHINQEKKSRSQSAYWINFKNEQRVKKLQQQQQRQKKSSR
jgi:hypothetical protein